MSANIDSGKKPDQSSEEHPEPPATSPAVEADTSPIEAKGRAVNDIMSDRIGDYAEANISAESIHIPAGTRHIGKGAYSNNHAVTSIVVPEGVETIEEFAFSNCPRLSEVTIPSTLKRAEACIFNRCKNLRTVHCPENWTWVKEDLVFTGTVTAECDGDTIGSRRYFDGRMLQTVIVPEGVTRIGERAFLGCINLKHITLPSTLEYIDDFAFYNCKSLESVTFPEGLKVISDGAFKGCDSLESLDIPESVTEIGVNAFANCLNLGTIRLPKNIRRLPVFAGCKLKSIEIPASITHIPESAFLGAEFTDIDIPDSVQTIGAEAFCFTQNLDHTRLPEGLKILNYGTFGWSGVKSVHLPDSLRRIESNAFAMSHIEHIEIPDNVASIGVRAFENCYYLKSVILGASLYAISRGTFKDCKNLETVICRNPTPPKCDDSVWSWAMLNGERHLYVPSGSEQAYAEHPAWGKKFAGCISSI